MRTANTQNFFSPVVSAFILVTLVSDYGRQTVNLPAKPIAAMRLGDGAVFLSFRNRAPLIYKNGRVQRLKLRKF